MEISKDYLNKFKRPEKKPNSARAEQIEKLCLFMDGDLKRFKYWLGRTRKLQPNDIYLMLKKSKEGRNPRALFNYLLKTIKAY